MAGEASDSATAAGCRSLKHKFAFVDRLFATLVSLASWHHS